MVAQDPFFSLLLQQLLLRLPQIVVHVTGLIFALIYLRRIPKAATFCLVGCGLMVFTSVGTAVVLALFNREQQMGVVAGGNMFAWMGFFSVPSTVLAAVGSALILTAVFVSRTPAEVQRPELPMRADSHSNAAPLSDSESREAVQRRNPLDR